MNQFIFTGFYDAIIRDFGWQAIQIGVPFTINLEDNFKDATYLLEQTITITEQQTLTNTPKQLVDIQKTFPKKSLGKLIIYNPDKWQAVILGFYAEKPIHNEATLYEILHISVNERYAYF